MKKKGIIINLGGQLANQLWTYLSIWAYCREKDYDCSQLSFYQYCHHFPNTRGHWLITPFFNILNRLSPKRKSFIKSFLYPKLILNRLEKKSDRFLNARGTGDESLLLLPPTPTNNPNQAEQIKKLEESDGPIYFNGPNFRNPIGAAKYRDEICQLFSPRQSVKNIVNNFVGELRKKYEFIVGVHIRQSDYRTFGEKFYIPPEKAAAIITDFYATRPKEEKICFIIASDEKIDLNLFGTIPVVAAPGTMMEDLFTLSTTDFIIGSNSSFSAFAAYYGDIAMAIFKDDPIDWSLFDKQKKFVFDPGSIAHLMIYY